MRMLTECGAYHVKAALVAVSLTAVAYFFEGQLGFNLADEGYLWYGAKHVLLGELPRLDFIAYDPARYFWSAAVMFVRHDDGLTSLWISTAILQAAALLLAFVALRQTSTSNYTTAMFLVGSIFMCWMIPRHKTIDIFASLLLLTTLTLALENLSKQRVFWAGATIGMATLIGRNHGLYGLGSHLLAISLVCLGKQNQSVSVSLIKPWMTGILLGLAPFMLLSIFFQGYAHALFQSFEFIFELIKKSQSTNLALPIPWPWRIDFNLQDSISTFRNLLIGLAFVVIVALALIGPLYVFRKLRTGAHVAPVLIASVSLVPFYGHHAFSRAEILHLAQGVFPALMILIVVTQSHRFFVAQVLGAGILLTSAFIVAPAHLGFQKAAEGNWQPVKIGNERIIVNNGTAATISTLQQIGENYLKGPLDTFLAVPYWPGAYAVLDRRAPLWEIYALFPRSSDFETLEISRIDALQPRFAIVQDIPLEGRDELRYSRTHPLTYRYITDHFRKLEPPFADKTIDLYVPANVGNP